MFVSGRFGLKSFDISNPLQPKLLDWLGDGVNDPFVAEANPGNGSQAPRKGTFDDMWENEDMDVDQHRKLVFLSRDPRAFGGSTGNPASGSGIYVIDVKNPERLTFVSFAATPTGHTTTCIDECRWLWTGGPAANTDQQAMGWAGRPIFVTDMRMPKQPKVNPNPIDLDRNDGTIDYSHDVQVDDAGIAWVSGRGGTRGYYTEGWHFDPMLGAKRLARPRARFRTRAGASRRRSSRRERARASCTTRGGRSATTRPTRATATSSTRPRRSSRAGPSRTAVPTTARSSSPRWRAATTARAGARRRPSKFRLKTIATWHPFGKEGSSTSTDCSAHYFQIEDRILSMSFYSQGSRFLDITDPTAPTEIAYFRPGTGTWATYPHRGLYYSADRNGVYVLRLTVGAGQLSKAAAHGASRRTRCSRRTTPAMPEADPQEEAIALLERPHGAHCSWPLE